MLRSMANLPPSPRRGLLGQGDGSSCDGREGINLKGDSWSWPRHEPADVADPLARGRPHIQLYHGFHRHPRATVSTDIPAQRTALAGWAARAVGGFLEQQSPLLSQSPLRS